MKTLYGKSLIIILAIGLLAACGGQPTEAPASPPTEAAVSATEAPTQPPAATEPPAQPTDTAAPAATEPAAQGTTVSFANDVSPLLQSRCLGCHGGDRTSEGLSIKSYADVMTGSSNGPVVVAGDAANSLLVQLVANQKMPKRGPKLTPSEVQLITDWVNQGALDN